MARTDWQYNEIVTESDFNQLAQEINERETIIGAQEKAQLAEDNAKAYTDEEIGQVTEAITSHEGDRLQHTPYAIASGTNTYTVSIAGIAALAEGLSVKIKFTNANTGAATLNINSLGAVSIRKGNGNTLASGNIKAGQVVHLVYVNSVFQLLGEGGEYGDATAADVLAGKIIGTENGLVTGTIPSKGAATITPGTANQTIAAGQYLSGVQTIASLGGTATAAQVLTGNTFSSNSAGRAVSGTMANRGAVNQTLTTQGGQYTIPQGYHSGAGVVKASFPNLITENVRQGINIGGVVGTLSDFSSIIEPIYTEGTWHISDYTLYATDAGSYLSFTPGRGEGRYVYLHYQNQDQNGRYVYLWDCIWTPSNITSNQSFSIQRNTSTIINMTNSTSNQRILVASSVLLQSGNFIRFIVSYGDNSQTPRITCSLYNIYRIPLNFFGQLI